MTQFYLEVHSRIHLSRTTALTFPWISFPSEDLGFPVLPETGLFTYETVFILSPVPTPNWAGFLHRSSLQLSTQIFLRHAQQCREEAFSNLVSKSGFLCCLWVHELVWKVTRKYPVLYKKNRARCHLLWPGEFRGSLGQWQTLTLVGKPAFVAKLLLLLLLATAMPSVVWFS